MTVIMIILSFIYLYQLFFILSSLVLERNKKGNPAGENNTSFAVFIPAHNEENVISKSVSSLVSAKYPWSKYVVYVIADNCTDKTAERARAEGAVVLERENLEQKGKQHALKWAFDKVDLNKFDAVLILDADNLIDPNLFSVLDYYINRGHKVVQAYVETQNPSENWITINNAYMFWYILRLQMIKSRLGMSAWLAGTGVCICTEILKKVPWELHTLTDDVEYTCKLLLEGEKVYLADGAVIYDQKPNKLKDSLKQRTRWIRGQTQVCYKYLPSLIKETIKFWVKGQYKKSLVVFDSLMWVPMQFVMLISFLISIISQGQYYLLSLFISVPALYILPILAEKIKMKEAWLYLFSSGFYFLTWIPITIYGIYSFSNNRWVRTPHHG